MVIATTTAVITVATMMTKAASIPHHRHELKYQINSADDLMLSSRLRQLFSHDNHANTHGTYRVCSLYFDTPQDSALRQKIDGISRREKFRLRYYNNDLSFIKLEKKAKVNGLNTKQSATISKEQVHQLLQGDIEFLLHSGQPLFVELYSKMKGQLLQPKTIVTYEREAFIYEPGNVRITLDRNLHSGMKNLDFLNPNSLHTPVLDDLTILEVKYDAFLPDVVCMAVQIPNRSACAYSKYATCRRYD